MEPGEAAVVVRTHKNKGAPARVCLKQVLPALRALWYGGTVVLNADIDHGSLMLRRPHTVVMDTYIVGAATTPLPVPNEP